MYTGYALDIKFNNKINKINSLGKILNSKLTFVLGHHLSETHTSPDPHIARDNFDAKPHFLRLKQ